MCRLNFFVWEKQKDMSQINAEEELQRQIQPHTVRNMTVSVTEGVLDAIAMGMIPLNTVVTYFISDYVNNSFLIGLLPTLQSACNAIVQILLGEKLRGRERFKPLCNLGTFLFRCAWLIISILILFFNRMQPIGFVCVFYAIYCFNGLCQGITSLTYTQMMNKVIPNRVKGRFFGVRGALNSAAGIIGAQIGGAVIASSGDVRRFGWLFLIAFALDMISVACQCAMVEPAIRMGSAQPAHSHRNFFTDFGRLMKRDSNIASYVVAMFLITIGMSFFTFQTAHSKEALGLTGGQLGIVTTIMYVTQTAGYLFWGWLSDRKGYRLPLIIGQVGFVAYLILAFLVKNAQMTYVMTAIYGLANSANLLGSRNMVFKMCPYDERVSYYGVVNMTLTVAAATASMMTGALIDGIGYGASALACLLMTVPGLILLLRVRERPPMESELR